MKYIVLLNLIKLQKVLSRYMFLLKKNIVFIVLKQCTKDKKLTEAKYESVFPLTFLPRFLVLKPLILTTKITHANPNTKFVSFILYFF